MANKFDKEIDKALGTLEKEISKAIRSAGLYGWNLATAATPVATGRARVGWLLEADALPITTPPKVGGSKERIYSDPPPPNVKFDLPQNRHLYILNNVEYIEYLEFGTPKIAPFAMLTNAVPKINAKLERDFKAIRRIE